MDWNAKHAKMLAKVTDKGAPVSFPTSAEGVYDEDSDTYGAPGAPSSIDGKAIEIPGDPEEYETLGLVAYHPITLFFVPNTINTMPALNAVTTWAGEKRTIKQRFPIRPAGQALAVRLILT